MIKESARSYCQ